MVDVQRKIIGVAPFKGKWGWRYWELVFGIAR